MGSAVGEAVSFPYKLVALTPALYRPPMSKPFCTFFPNSIFILTLATSASAIADEGMWLFNAPPLKQLKEKYQFESTPLMVNGRLYSTAGTRRAVVALDPVTGEQLWMLPNPSAPAGARQREARLRELDKQQQLLLEERKALESEADKEKAVAKPPQ